MTKKILWGGLSLAVFSSVSCATFQADFSRLTARQAQAVRSGKIESVVAEIEAKAKTDSKQQALHALQAGTYHLFLRDYAKSREFFQLAEKEIIDYERAAVISTADAAALAQSLLASDLELPYKGDGFEKIMLNTILALDYLFLGDVEGAAVEVRRADQRQKQEQDAHQKELERLETQKKDQKIEGDPEGELAKQYGVLDTYSAAVVSSFQNGFTYYLSGLIYELNRQPNDAYIDYQKSYTLHRNRSTLEKLYELAGRLSFREEQNRWRGLGQELYGTDLAAAPAKAGLSDLLVIYFAGQVPTKQPIKLSLPIGGQIMSVAFPIFATPALARVEGGLEVLIDGAPGGLTESVLDFVPIVTRALKEKIPAMAIRQVLRVLAKSQVNKTAEKELGSAGKDLANIFNWLTERADLRGWYELPRSVQVLRARVEPGQGRKITWKAEAGAFAGQNTGEITVDIPRGGTAVVLIQNLAGLPAGHVQTFAGGR